ncbi:hypothetical protein [Paraburkholderia sp. D15]|uniref:hypothetical protein n=1 Tax=Paraburkholderia sp. D15 TaxID=2880218 RepID=UPI0032B07DCF
MILIVPPLMPLRVVELESPEALSATGGAAVNPPSLFGKVVPGTGLTLSAVPFWFLPIDPPYPPDTPSDDAS